MAKIFFEMFLVFLPYVAVDLISNRLAKGARFFFRSLVMYVFFAIGIAVWYAVVEELGLADILVAEVFFYFFWAFYTIFFVNVQNSFSLGLLQVILQNPQRKILVKDLVAHFDLPASLEKRVISLRESGLVSEDSQKRLWVTPKGRLISRGTVLLRSILRITDVG